MNPISVHKKDVYQNMVNKTGAKDLKSINEYTSNILHQIYKNNTSPKIITPIQAEELEFMRASDAEVLAQYCKENNTFISFRKAGKHTIKHIKNGSPCKGSDIKNKTIKEENSINYKGIDLTPYLGLLLDNSNNEPGVVAIDNEAKTTLYLKEITKEDFTKCYTGDYDSCDLIVNNRRIENYSDEQCAIYNSLNLYIAQYALEYYNYTEADIFRYKRIANHSNNHKDPYSFIRHGDQNCYINELLLRKESLFFREEEEEDIDATACIILDYLFTNLAFFAPDGNIYSITTPESCYLFYKRFDILHLIPSFAFLNEIQKVNKEQLEKLDSNSNDHKETSILQDEIESIIKYIYSLIYL